MSRKLPWRNFECQFSTLNTSNELGNSTYYVWSDCILRKAPVNKIRAPDEAEVVTAWITYINPADNKRFMKTGRTSIVRVDDEVAVLAGESNSGIQLFTSRRIPKVGWSPFDVIFQRDRIVEWHIGHSIVQLKEGKPAVPRPLGVAAHKHRCRIM
jgi:hypothetical protein